MLVYSIRVLQGKVAMRFKCDGNFNVSFVANFLENESVKIAENPLRINKVIDKALCTTFLKHIVVRLK